ncbi:carbohydrate ABC transporter permease [Romboutsia weinsteinii]|uniref:Carbohydrate ABC transporter permease n=1 Tax=Romboutsia weinsteinii TaxID=2020949 RepID=A0A371IX90_9FIRM|nr:carbohydrate ABC transporter permease [Romboutsia weinsteinii]RDY25096.1 carbohydrate ABC transporter permease [Romboutsia weinsteinii]
MGIKNILKKTIIYGSLLIWSIAALLPILTIFFGSFKSFDEFTNTTGITLPDNFFNMSNYKSALLEGNMLVGFFNTFILVLFGVIGSLIVGSMVAYAINRLDFKGKKLILLMYLIVSIVPMEISQVATFKLIDKIGLYNTRLAPMLIYIGADVIMIYIYLQALDKVPRELDKAAMLEGANYFHIYRKIILPLVKPATVSIIMIKIISIYNDFYIPFLYMPDKELQTVSTTLFKFIGPYEIQWQIICAGIIISMIPMIIFFIFLQKHIYEGLTSGSIK